MTDSQLDRLEAKVIATATAFPYPPTPEVAVRVRQRLRQQTLPGAHRFAPGQIRRSLAWAAVTLALVIIGLLSVPQVRARVIEFFQIGVVRIFPVAPTEAPTPQGTITPTPTLLPSLLNLSGETTLEAARAQTGFAIPLPGYPADLGPPDQVYVQEMEGSFVILVWLDPAQPSQVRLSLHMIAPHSFALTKHAPKVIETTAVNRQIAFWTEGPYLIRLTNGDTDIQRLIDGHVLIWEQDGLTYRLETDLSISEAVKIAESLK